MNIRLTKALPRGRFELWLEKPEFEFLHVHQVHGLDIASPHTLPTQADGLIVSWAEFDKPLAIKTADCLPIVIEGEKGVVFLHAGWRGLAAQILLTPEVALIRPNLVYIGPSIQSCCFEVSEDFRHNFPSEINFKKRSGKLYFDLQAEAKRQIQSKFPCLQVIIDENCTYCSDSFHSYRKNKTDKRNWNIYSKG